MISGSSMRATSIPKSEADYSSIFDGQQNEYYDQNQQVATPWHDPAQLDGLLAVAFAAHGAACLVPRAQRRIRAASPFRLGRRYYHHGRHPGPDLRRPCCGFALLDVSIPVSSGFRYDMVPDTATDFQRLILPAAPFGLFRQAADGLSVLRVHGAGRTLIPVVHVLARDRGRSRSPYALQV